MSILGAELHAHVLTVIDRSQVHPGTLGRLGDCAYGDCDATIEAPLEGRPGDGPPDGGTVPVARRAERG